MNNRNHLAPATAWISGLAGLGWALSASVNSWLISSQTRLPGQFVNLLFPKTLDNTTWRMIAPWPVLLLVFSSLAVAGLTVVILGHAGSRAKRHEEVSGPGFLAIWMCIILAAFGTALLISVGNVFATWPPSRLAAILDGVEPNLWAAGYWGIIWGWVPALVGARILRENNATTAGKKRLSHPNAIFGFATILIAAALLISWPLAHNASVQTRANLPAPTPEPTPEPMVYGSPELSTAFQEVGENWCAGDQVSISWGEPDAATGHRGMGFMLTNAGTSSCVLESYPDVAFDDTNGMAMDIMAVNGGSFMTSDPGISSITVSPGASAQAFIGWNAMAAAGDTRAGKMLVAPYAGTLRQSSLMDLDIVNGGTVSLTAWELVEDTK